jgi:hypothetical protein
MKGNKMVAKKTRKSKVPVEAIQELADKSPQEASIGGTVSETVAEKTEDGVQVDLDYLRSTRVHLAMPCHNGLVTETSFGSFIKFSNAARQFGIEWSIETVTNEQVPARARNTLAAKFLSQEDKSHLMFIDSENGWEPWHLLVLLNRKVDVISGLYSTKTIPIRWVVNVLDNAEEGPDGLHEVARTGAGFMLIKRDVFSKLDNHPDVVQYSNDTAAPAEHDKYLRTYFNAGVKNGVFNNEDWNFCDNWRSVGGKVYVDKRVMLSHRGGFSYSAQLQDVLITTLGQSYLEAMKSAGKIQMIETAAETAAETA